MSSDSDVEGGDRSADRDDRAIAYHEAGHAVVGIKFGLPVREASIIPAPERRSEGHVELDEDAQEFHMRVDEFSYDVDDGIGVQGPVRDEVEQHAVYTLAGALAAQRAGSEEEAADMGAGLIDLQEDEAQRLSERLGFEVNALLKGDWLSMAMLMDLASHEDEDLKDQWTNWILWRAERVVKECWSDIERVAEALLERRSLSRNDLLGLMGLDPDDG